MRRLVTAIVVCLSALVLLADEQDATRKKIEAKKRAVDADQGAKRVELADWCANKGLIKEARDEYDKAISLVGGNQKWEKDRDNLQFRERRKNRNQPDDAEDRVAYDKSKKKLAEAYAKLYAELAKQARDAGLDDLAGELDARAGGAAPPPPSDPADDPPKEAPPKNGKKEPPPPVYGPQQAADRINWYRQLAGLDPAAFDDTIAKGAAAHANYLAINNIAPSLAAHTEDPEIPGYTPEGHAAGQASDICWGPPANAVDELMSELFHRIPVLRPAIERIGVGHASGGRITVIDLQSGLTDADVERVIVFPVPDQTDVPTRLGNETPNPLPPGSPRDAGYPITLTQYERKIKITDVAASLIDADGIPVEVHLSTPESPAHPIYQLNTVGLIPVQSLRGGTKYTATVACNMGGVPFEKTWSFTTK